MGIEIEKKFLVKDDSWRQDSDSTFILQGYLSAGCNSVRIRMRDRNAFITIKGERVADSRLEFEYPIPAEDAEILLRELCQRPLIEKIRHVLQHKGTTWEVDEFLGENEGLVLAELESASEEFRYEPPPWLGTEVSHDPRYSNSNLAVNPFNRWQADLSS